MNLRQLGRTGLQVTAVGLGCNNFGMRIDEDASRLVIDAAIDAGITLFDTADIYGNRGGSETIIGKVLGSRRQQIVLATKFAMPMSDDSSKRGGSRRYIMSAVEDSLRRLQTDWIDLYQMHDFDPSTPIEETLRALDDLVTQGKVRYIGCSNLAAWQVVESLWSSDRHHAHAFASCQDEYSLLKRDLEKDMIPMAHKHGLGILPYFPLASGLLTGKYSRGAEAPVGTRFSGSERLQNRYMTDRNWQIVEELTVFASERGHSLLDLAFSWLLAKPQISSVIAGATKPEQIHANVEAGAWALTSEEVAEVDRISAT